MADEIIAPGDAANIPQSGSKKVARKARKPPELDPIVRERRDVVDFLITFDPTKSERSYMGPRPTEALRQSLTVRDRQATLRVIRTSLESIMAKCGPRVGRDMPDSPLLCAWASLGRVLLPRPGDPEAPVFMQIAGDEIRRARGLERYVGDDYLLGLLVAELHSCSEPD